MDSQQRARRGEKDGVPKESLGRKLLRLLLQFCACLVLLPALLLLGGIGALVGLFVGSPLRAALAGLLAGVVLGGIAFTVIANYYAGSPQNSPPGGAGGMGDGGGGASD